MPTIWAYMSEKGGPLCALHVRKCEKYNKKFNRFYYTTIQYLLDGARGFLLLQTI